MKTQGRCLPREVLLCFEDALPAPHCGGEKGQGSDLGGCAQRGHTGCQHLGRHGLKTSLSLGTPRRAGPWGRPLLRGTHKGASVQGRAAASLTSAEHEASPGASRAGDIPTSPASLPPPTTHRIHCLPCASPLCCGALSKLPTGGSQGPGGGRPGCF